MNKEFQEKLNSYINSHFNVNIKIEPIYDIRFRWFVKLLYKIRKKNISKGKDKWFLKSSCQTCNICCSDKKINVTLSDEKSYHNNLLYVDYCYMNETVLWQIQFNSHNVNIEYIFQLLNKVYYKPLERGTFSESYFKPLFKNCNFMNLLTE